MSDDKLFGQEPDQKRGVILIGMPGSGKSTVGVLLAKALSRPFIDTDLIIQAVQGMRLQDLINSKGLDAFLAIEETCIAGIQVGEAVVSTGGSVPLRERAMHFLKNEGIAVHLELPLDELRRRITNMDSRGIALAPGQSFDELYDERMPLYKKYADLTVNCDGLDHEGAVAAVQAALLAYSSR
jgi:shikimate kinase